VAWHSVGSANPPPAGWCAAPPGEHADNPFILEFPIQDAGLWPITNYRRIREHRRLTLLLNLLLAGTTKFLPDRRRHFWACVPFDPNPEFKWVQEWYSADLGQAVTNELSATATEKLEELESDRYYKEVGHDERRKLRVPDDLDDLICRYQSFQPGLQASSIARPIG
jgi:hypothetical protein